MRKLSILRSALAGPCILLLFGGAVLAQDVPDVPHYLGAGTTESRTQSKLWHHDCSWWAVLPDGEDHYIHRFDGHGFVADRDLLTSSKLSARADVVTRGDDLYVLMAHVSTPEFLRFRYDRDRRAYDQVAGFPVPAPVAGGWEHPPRPVGTTRRAGITLVAAGDVHVIWSTSADHTTWDTTGLVLESGVDRGDVSSVVVFDGKVGVMWSDQTRERFAFRYHADGDAPGAWAATEVVIAAPQIAEDHLNLAATPAGEVLAVTKDRRDDISFFRRDPAAGWDARVVVAADGTRPVVLYDRSNDEVNILFTRLAMPSPIILKRAPLAATHLFGAAPEFEYLARPGESLNNVTSTRQTVDKDSGLLAVAQGDVHAYFHWLSLGALEGAGRVIARVNFQPTGLAPPTGYVADTGEVYDAARGYGWSTSLDWRAYDEAGDLRLDTYVFHANGAAPAVWEYPLADGDYVIDLVVGSPRWNGVHYASIEGVRVVDGVPTGSGEFVEVLGREVSVRDGRLTIAIGDPAGSKKTKLCYVTITEANGSCFHEPRVTALSTPDEGGAPLLVQFAGNATSPRGSIVAYAWDFGDGATSTEQNPTHTYTAPGQYETTLTVLDSLGLTSFATVTVNILGGPVAHPSAPYVSGPAPLTVPFTGAGNTPNGAITDYFWDFGDGATSSAKDPTHEFSATGTYTVRLTVTDEAAQSAWAELTVTATAPPAAGGVLARVNFQPAGSAAPEGYTVDAGATFDGTRGFGWAEEVDTNEREVNPDQRLDTYVQISNPDGPIEWDYVLPNGQYLVTVVAGAPAFSAINTIAVEGAVVIDGVFTQKEFVEVVDHPVTVTDGRLTLGVGAGSSKKTKLCYVTITSVGAEPGCEGLPTATATASRLTGDAPLAVAFAGAGDSPCGAIIGYRWDFGDDAISSDQDPSHTFVTPGLHVVTLAVTDEHGHQGATSLTLEVFGAATASASATPVTGSAPLEVRFTGNGSSPNGGIVSWSWEFGDGAGATGQNPVHTYADAGTYPARLVVTDVAGRTAQATVTVVVEPPVDPPGVVAQVNFQPAGFAMPDGYVADTGADYSDARGYGWDTSLDTREYDTQTDPRLNTYVFHANTAAPANWNYALSNGTYTVTLVAGAPRWTAIQHVAIEGETVIDGAYTAGEFVEVTDYPVTVTDGTLTVTLGGGTSKKTKLCYVIITRTN